VTKRTECGRGSRKKVLVADDEAEVREVLTEYLAVQGFEVLEAGNGLETLLQVKRARPEAVVLDLAMPRLGGLEALKRIRAFDPAITVVIASGRLDDGVRRQAMALGARAVLVKPLELADLLAALGGAERPVQAATASRETRPGSPEPRVTATGPGAKVLVIDDDPDMRTMLEEFLTESGHHVILAADGVSALREVQSAPDVALLDIAMPGLSGLDALPAIRAVAPDVVVIMVSGTANAEDAKRALALGAFDYVVKPVDLAYLTQSLQTALTMKRLSM
jgi:CheY-like chemotaxis protein